MRPIFYISQLTLSFVAVKIETSHTEFYSLTVALCITCPRAEDKTITDTVMASPALADLKHFTIKFTCIL